MHGRHRSLEPGACSHQASTTETPAIGLMLNYGMNNVGVFGEDGGNLFGSVLATPNFNSTQKT